jgi:hypothetical protein
LLLLLLLLLIRQHLLLLLLLLLLLQGSHVPVRPPLTLDECESVHHTPVEVTHCLTLELTARGLQAHVTPPQADGLQHMACTCRVFL